MKTLELNEMEAVQGGSWAKGFCATFGTVGTFALVTGAAAATGVGLAVLGTAAAGCAVYGFM